MTKIGDKSKPLIGGIMRLAGDMIGSDKVNTMARIGLYAPCGAIHELKIRIIITPRKM